MHTTLAAQYIPSTLRILPRAMKSPRGWLLGLSFMSILHLNFAEDIIRRDRLGKQDQDDIPRAGVGALRAICNPGVAECRSHDAELEERLVQAFEASSQAAGETTSE